MLPRTTSRPRAVLVPTALVVVLAVGGTAFNALRSDDASLQMHNDDGYRFFTEPHDVRMLAAGSGVLTYLEKERCLVLRPVPIPGFEQPSDVPVSHQLVIWPQGTTVDDEDTGGITVTVPDQGSFRLGDPVDLGGGGLLDAEVAEIQATYNLPDRCVEGGIFTAWKVAPYVEDPRRAELMRTYQARQARPAE